MLERSRVYSSLKLGTYFKLEIEISPRCSEFVTSYIVTVHQPDIHPTSKDHKWRPHRIKPHRRRSVAGAMTTFRRN